MQKVTDHTVASDVATILRTDPGLAADFVDGGYGFDLAIVSARIPAVTPVVAVISQNPNGAGVLVTTWPDRATFDRLDAGIFPTSSVTLEGVTARGVINVTRVLLAPEAA